MFKLVKSPTFWWPVDVYTPSADTPGRTVKQTFEALFEAIGIDEANRLLAQPETPATRGDEVLKRVVKGWRDVIDDDGVAVPFTPETFDAALDLGWVRNGLLAAYTVAIAGDGARLGN